MQFFEISYFAAGLIYRLIYLLTHLFYVKPKNSYCRQNATCGAGTFFHHEAMVHNLRRKRESIRIGNHTHIRGELLVYAHGGQITIGDYCYIGVRSVVWSSTSITIGNRVLIAHNVNIHDNNSHPVDPAERHEHHKKIITTGHPASGIALHENPVVIHDDAWIGFNASVLKGVTIGRASIVGAGAVVTENVPDYAIVVGNPARIIGYVNKTT